MITIQLLEEMLEKFRTGKLEEQSNKVEDLKSRSIVLYGAGNVGRRLYRNLKDSGINIECFIDRNKAINSVADEIPIYHPEDKRLNDYKKIPILFSLLYFQ